MIGLRKMPVWQKRFRKKIDPLVLEFTNSIEDDAQLVFYDVLCSIIHSAMLKEQKLISSSENNKIKNGLLKIIKDWKNGKFRLLPEYEDVHMNVEFQLAKSIGKTSEKLHTARSRNDLIATDLRLFCRDQIIKIAHSIIDLQSALHHQAKKYESVIIPGYTHLQQAQPMLASFYLVSFFYKFQRDFEQLLNLISWIDISPLGSCAFAGTGINIDPMFVARSLGMRQVCENSLDAVSDRDFLTDTLYYLTRINIHLSHLSEDLIIFCTSEFSLVTLDDSISTGSSIMPHKKNPDVIEILRAKAGDSIGNLVSALSILKGLPSSYNRDLQVLKSILIREINNTLSNLKIASLIVKKIKFHTPQDNWVKKPNWICLNDLMDFLVKNGNNFRRVYNLIAKLVSKSSNDIDLFIELLSHYTRLHREEIIAKLTPGYSIKNKTSTGSTGYRAVKNQVKHIQKLIRKNKRAIERVLKNQRFSILKSWIHNITVDRTKGI